MERRLDTLPESCSQRPRQPVGNERQGEGGRCGGVGGGGAAERETIN